MLKLGRSLAICSHGSPIIRPSDILLYSSVDHGFYCEYVTRFHEASSFVVGIMGNVGGAVKKISDSVTAVSSVYR
jgi:hypothetical protein